MAEGESGPALRSRAVLERCATHGFALAGIAAAMPSRRAAEYRAWIAAARHGGMSYLAESVEARLDPRVLLPGARSVLCVADRYADGSPDARVPGLGRIARYARGEDYHVVIRARLEALADELRAVHADDRFRVCVDSAPILEREHAERAGIGRIGKHTLVIGPAGFGSWLLLGVMVTTLDLAPVRADSAAGLAPAEGDPCGSCTRCIDACPTQAIAPWSVDATRCISAATIEERGALAGWAARTEDWLFGCDTCQEVCPHAQPTRRSRRTPVHEAYRAHRTSLPLLDVLGWSDADYEAARLNGVLRRASRVMWQRNAAWAAGAALRDPHVSAADAAALRTRLGELATGGANEDAPVREAAAEALRVGSLVG
ncbi:MAG: tRNA epoxyqueuosine(34) reductase QueG [Planctomycetota bacterium]